MLVYPSQVVPQHVVKEPLSALEDCLQFLGHRLLIFNVFGDQSSVRIFSNGTAPSLIGLGVPLVMSTTVDAVPAGAGPELTI
jgi:hypothetical protein